MPQKDKPAILMGIDPGLATTGYGIISCQSDTYTVHEAGTITTESDQPFGQRLLHIHDDVTALIKEFRPSVIGIEQLFFARNVTTALTVGQARGVIYLAGEQAGITVREFTPLQVKQAVTGYGQADKVQMQKMITTILKLTSVPQPDDVADALAIAVCCAHTRILPT